MKKLLSSFALTTLLLCHTAQAENSYKLAGKIIGGTGANSVLLISKLGVTRATITNSKFSIGGVKASRLKNAKLYFFKDGQPVGPGALKESAAGKFLTFSGKAPAKVKKLSLNLQVKSGYLLAKNKIDAAWIGKSKVKSQDFAGASLGYKGISTTGVFLRPARIQVTDGSDVGADTDVDGVPDILDIDDDNDGIPDDRDTGGGSMISTMYLNFAATINSHLGNLNDTTIANTLSGDGVFGLTFFIQANNDLAGATGGHVICDPSQVICRSQADGGTTSIYSGVSESDPAVKNQIWSSFNTDGSGKPNLEVIHFGSNNVLVAAIQPRSAMFSAGELMTVEVTNGSSIVGTRVFTILPPVISSPMLASYDVGAGVQNVDYSSASTPGSSGGFPIVLTGNSMTFNFYPPQRKPFPGVEADGEFRDIGESRLGVILGGQGISQEFTCAGYYSGLSTGFDEIPASQSMPGGTIGSQAGAVPWPINDSGSDVASSSGGLKSLTVNLASCLSRGGAAPGTYMATIMYAGSDTNFGAPRSGQNVFVTIPAPS